MLDHDHLEPTPRARAYGLGRLRRQAERLLKFLELDTPDVILAHELANMHEAATLALGVHYWAELGRRAMGVERRHAALCQDCDSGVAVARSHPPYCEACEAKYEAMGPHGEEGADGEGR